MQDKKSLFTNLISVACIGVGYALPDEYGDFFKSFGYFAFSGAITNWLAIYMLFEKVPLLYGSGVIPMHFMEFKQGIKSLIMGQFFNEENIRIFFTEKMLDANPIELFDKIAPRIDFNVVFDQLVEEILRSSFGGMLGMLGGAKILENLREPCIHRFKNVLQDMIQGPLMDELKSSNNWQNLPSQIEQIVDARLYELTPQMVKEIVQAMIQKHLGWLVVWGGVFGGLIGLVMFLI